MKSFLNGLSDNVWVLFGVNDTGTYDNDYHYSELE